MSTDENKYRYAAMIGVGGIGSGSFFAFNGNHTLGREESRGGRFLDRKDYCKLHIISHYVKAILGPDFDVIPVGKVGDDRYGSELLNEMKEVGLDLRYVIATPGDQTLYSFCFIYPDGSGGNMTTDDSACSKLDANVVRGAENEFRRYEGRGIALVVPEVSLEAREALLRLATEHDFFRAASFTSEEMGPAIEASLLRYVDLLAINLDEAIAVLGYGSNDESPAAIAEVAIKKLMDINSDLLISITAGRHGSWCWDGSSIFHTPIHKVEAVSTAGAGDAHLAGLITGLVLGLDLKAASSVAAMVAGIAVTSPHTINKDIDHSTLKPAFRIWCPNFS